MHLIRHATVVKTSAKKKSNNPVNIAPKTLVAAKVTANNINARSTVPKTAISKALIIGHKARQGSVQLTNELETSATAKNPTAIPKTTHKNAGVTVIIAANVKNAAITPTIALQTTAAVRQLKRLLQQHIDIFLTSL